MNVSFRKMEQSTHTTIIIGVILSLILSVKYTNKENSLLLYGEEFGMEKLIGLVFHDGTLTSLKYVQLILNCKVTDLMETMPLSFSNKYLLLT